MESAIGVARHLPEPFPGLVPAVAALGGLLAQQAVESLRRTGLLQMPSEVGVDVAVVGQGVPEPSLGTGPVALQQAAVSLAQGQAQARQVVRSCRSRGGGQQATGEVVQEVMETICTQGP